MFIVIDCRAEPGLAEAEVMLEYLKVKDKFHYFTLSLTTSSVLHTSTQEQWDQAIDSVAAKVYQNKCVTGLVNWRLVVIFDVYDGDSNHCFAEYSALVTEHFLQPFEDEFIHGPDATIILGEQTRQFSAIDLKQDFALQKDLFGAGYNGVCNELYSMLDNAWTEVDAEVHADKTFSSQSVDFQNQVKANVKVVIELIEHWKADGYVTEPYKGYNKRFGTNIDESKPLEQRRDFYERVAALFGDLTLSASKSNLSLRAGSNFKPSNIVKKMVAEHFALSAELRRLDAGARRLSCFLLENFEKGTPLANRIKLTQVLACCEAFKEQWLVDCSQIGKIFTFYVDRHVKWEQEFLCSLRDHFCEENEQIQSIYPHMYQEKLAEPKNRSVKIVNPEVPKFTAKGFSAGADVEKKHWEEWVSEFKNTCMVPLDESLRQVKAQGGLSHSYEKKSLESESDENVIYQEIDAERKKLNQSFNLTKDSQAIEFEHQWEDLVLKPLQEKVLKSRNQALSQAKLPRLITFMSLWVFGLSTIVFFMLNDTGLAVKTIVSIIILFLLACIWLYGRQRIRNNAISHECNLAASELHHKYLQFVRSVENSVAQLDKAHAAKQNIESKVNTLSQVESKRDKKQAQQERNRQGLKHVLAVSQILKGKLEGVDKIYSVDLLERLDALAKRYTSDIDICIANTQRSSSEESITGLFQVPAATIDVASERWYRDVLA